MFKLTAKALAYVLLLAACLTLPAPGALAAEEAGADTSEEAEVAADGEDTAGEAEADASEEAGTSEDAEVDAAEEAAATKVTLYAGDTYQLVAPEEGTVSFASSDEGVATVTDEGLVTGIAAGEACVTITCDMQDGSGQTVTSIDVVVRRLTPTLVAEDIVTSYTTEKLTAAYETDSDGEVTLTSSDTTKVAIGAAGRLKIKRLGTCTITIKVAKTDIYKAASTKISVTVESTVTAAKVGAITRSGKKLSITWTAVEGASEYGVYRKVGTGTWKRVAVVGSDVLSYTDTGITSGITYRYRVRTYGVNRRDYSAFSAKSAYRWLRAPASLRVENLTGSMQLMWAKVENASGYYVYRNGKRIKTVRAVNTLSYRDASAANGKVYTYSVIAYHTGTGCTGNAVKRVRARVKSKRVKKLTVNSRCLTVKWARNKKATGYQLQYSTSPLFISKKTVKIVGNAKLSKTVKGLKAGTTYYVRVRPYLKAANGAVTYAAWRHSGNVSTTKNATVTYVKVKGKKIELRALTKQSMFGYDTVQGSCTDGTYGYYIMYKRTVENCRIAKVKLSNMKLVKLSAVLPICHGNGITYNADTNRLVVTHASSQEKKISTINANTLKLKSTVSLELTTSVAGISSSQTGKGFSAITYNSTRKQYALLTRGTGNLVITDANLVPIRYITPTQKDGQLLQCLDSTKDYILIGQSFSGSKRNNLVSAYTWDGTFVTRINLGTGFELESIYHIGSTFYVITYRSYYSSTVRRDNYVQRFRF